MKTSALLVAATSALAMAQNQPQDQANPAKDLCKQANTTFCLSGDIILHCTGEGVGETSRCTPALTAYPPVDGVARCYEKVENAGQAACEKNCVVYASPSYTMAAPECTPEGTKTAPAIVATPTPTAQYTEDEEGEEECPPIDEPTQIAPTQTYNPSNNTMPTYVPTGAATKTTVGGAALVGIFAAFLL